MENSVFRKGLVIGIIILLFGISILPCVNGLKTDLETKPVITISTYDDSWTLLFYLCGDNDMEIAAVNEFVEISDVGSTDDVNLIVQLDRGTGWPSGGGVGDETRYGNWTDAKRYNVSQNTSLGMRPTPENATQHLGEVNMGHPQTLIDFVEWGVTNYPAANYAVVFWDHANGIYGACQDSTSNGDTLSLFELKSAFETVYQNTLVKPDLIDYSACLMQMIEGSYQLRDYTSYVVASQETMSHGGLPFTPILENLTENPGWSPEKLGIEMVNIFEKYHGYYEDAQSCVNVAHVNDVVEKIDNFAQSLLNAHDNYYIQIKTCRNQTEHFHNKNYIDLYHFANLIYQNVPDTNLQQSANSLMYAINSFVVENFTAGYHPDANGISIYFPEVGNPWGDYSNLDIGVDTQWDEFLDYHLKRVYVDKSNTGYEDGSIEHPYNTIQEGVDGAISGFTIYVSADTYTSGTTVHKPVILKGKGVTIVDNSFSITAEHVTIEGFTILGDQGGFGIFCTANHTTIQDCDIHGCLWSGIYLFKSYHSLVDSCDIYSNSKYGVYLGSSSYNTINDCNIYSNEYGIYICDSSDHNVVDIITVNDNEEGIWVLDSEYNSIYGCNIFLNDKNGIYLKNSVENKINSDIYLNDCGIFLNSSDDNEIGGGEASQIHENSRGIYLLDSDFNTIFSSYVYDHDYYGVGLFYSDENIITTLSIRKAEDGIYLSESMGNNVNNCTIKENFNYGIHFDESSNNDMLDNEIFSDNHGLYLEEQSNENRISRNFVEQNNYGIILEYSMDNTIYDNYFDNTNNAMDDDNNFWNIDIISGKNIIDGPNLGGNYWSDYQGADSDGDGLGDTLTPYTSSGSIQNGGDMLPLKKPWKILIMKPVNGVYFFNILLWARDKFPFAFGKITFEVEMENAPADFSRVEFYVNGRQVTVLDDEPYSWLWRSPSIGFKSTVEVIAFDENENSVSNTITIRKLL